MKIDIAIPSYGDTQLEKCLNCLYESVKNSPFSINTIYFDFKLENRGYDSVSSYDKNPWIARKFCENYDIDINISVGNRNLPKSREFLINKIETEWFLFLDGDVMLETFTMWEMHDAIAPNVGGIQSRRITDKDPNWKWTYRRAVRATMFCTLIRKEAVKYIEIPEDITVLEDEYIRQYIENNDYLWVFNHQAKFRHESEERHKIDFNEGRIAGKYGLLPYDYVFLHVPYAIATKRSPIRFINRAIGYIYGKAKA